MNNAAEAFGDSGHAFLAHISHTVFQSFGGTALWVRCEESKIDRLRRRRAEPKLGGRAEALTPRRLSSAWL